MEEEMYTEVTGESWLSRIGGAITGILFGIVLIFGASGLLFWNEGRAVKTHKSLKEGAGLVTSIDNSTVDELNEGKLVHLSGPATTTQALKDSEFPVSATALALKRTVRMYQWQETKQSEKKKKAGGGEETVTTYTYEKIWSESLINSSNFKKPADHRNPGHKPFENRIVIADKVTLGAFILPGHLVSRISSYAPVPAAALPDSRQPVRLSDNGYYVGNNEKNPEIGDAMISFAAVMPTQVTLVAQQKGNSFAPYATSAGGLIEELAAGQFSAAEMFKNARGANTLMTWGLRFLGVFLLMIGFLLLFNPLSVVADVIPFAGNIVAMGAAVISFLFTMTISAAIIAMAWIAYRPVIAVFVLTGAVVIVFLWIRAKKG